MINVEEIDYSETEQVGRRAARERIASDGITNAEALEIVSGELDDDMAETAVALSQKMEAVFMEGYRAQIREEAERRMDGRAKVKKK